ncbi:MAG: TrkA family potassium uptake protein [Erysipelotrichaceae bacterium]|nr:TrkA family potassium uptake protein [Erysipelotrichaceae bacterium]
MSERKTYVILGLGRFGMTLARELTEMHQDVIAIDKNIEVVEKISPYVANALCLDYRDIDALKAAGVKDADVGVVSSGAGMDQGIIGLINLKELGIPKVVVKTFDSRSAEIMKKLGADDTITPEKDMASWCAKKMISKHIIELFDVDKEHVMFELQPLPNWVGRSLVDLGLRSKFQLNVIGIKHEDTLYSNIDPNVKLNVDDELLVFGPKSIFADFNKLNNI